MRRQSKCRGWREQLGPLNENLNSAQVSESLWPQCYLVCNMDFPGGFSKNSPPLTVKQLVNLVDISTDVCFPCYGYLYCHERSVSNIIPTEELQQLNFPSRILQYKSQSCASPLPSPNLKWSRSKVRAGSAIQKKQRMHFVRFTGINLWTNKQLL